MGWRFRKTIKLAPGLKINVGKTGITSATIGKRGASINIGKRGTYANLGIPGTGLSYRKKIKLNGAGNMKASKINQLEKLERLHSNGRISDSEYQQLRADILGYSYSNEEVPKKGCFTSLWTLIKWIFFIFVLFMGYSIYQKHNSQPKVDPVKSINSPPQVDPVKSINSPPSNTIEEKVIDRRLRYDENVDKTDKHENEKDNKSLDNLF